MRPVAPRLKGVEEVTFSNEEKYRAITAGIGETDEGARCWISRWRLSDEERARLARGEDVFVFVTQLGFPPTQVHIGSPYHKLDT